MSYKELSPRNPEWVAERQRDIARSLMRQMIDGLSCSNRGLDRTHAMSLPVSPALMGQLKALESLPIKGKELQSLVTGRAVDLDDFAMGRRLIQYGVAVGAVDAERDVSILDISNAMLLFGAQSQGRQGIVPVTLTFDTQGSLVTHPFLQDVPLLRQRPEHRTLFVPEFPWQAIEEAVAQKREVDMYHHSALEGPLYEPTPPQSVVPKRKEQAIPVETMEERAAQLLVAIRPIFDRLLKLDHAINNASRVDTGYVSFYVASPKIGFLFEEVLDRELDDLEMLLQTYYSRQTRPAGNGKETIFNLDPELATASVLRVFQQFDAQYAKMKPHVLHTGNSPLTNALANGYSLINRLQQLRVVFNRTHNNLRIFLTSNEQFNESIFFN